MFYPQTDWGFFVIHSPTAPAKM